MQSNELGRYKKRRERLCAALPKGEWVVLISAAIESSYDLFRQDKNFYYFTGLSQEPGAVLLLSSSGKSMILLPKYDGLRAKWAGGELEPSVTFAQQWGVDMVDYLGERSGLGILKPFEHEKWAHILCARLQEWMGTDATLYTPELPRPYVESYNARLVAYLQDMLQVPHERVCSLMPVIASLRRTKDEYELSCIRKAIDITGQAQRAVRKVIHVGLHEYELRAVIDAVFTQNQNSSHAFPSIVAAGNNATILHYSKGMGKVQEDELTIVDIGSEYAQYASDITRVHAVGTLTNRQKELYTVVRDVQAEIAYLAAPGMCLISPNDSDRSLHHRACTLLKQYDLDVFFVHGIGHFMGLDVHDVGVAAEPLMPGDVITIEPGVYLPNEGIGIRIEDNYVITDDGCQCLSAHIDRLEI